MGIEATGKIFKVFETKQVSDKFRKCEFVLEITDNPKYPQTVLFEATGDRCEQLDGLQEGDSVRVEFSLRGREWRSPSGDVKYFNSLDVWKVEPVGERKKAPAAGSATSPAQGAATTEAKPAEDDCPFATCDMDFEPSPIAKVLR